MDAELQRRLRELHGRLVDIGDGDCSDWLDATKCQFDCATMLLFRESARIALEMAAERIGSGRCDCPFAPCVHDEHGKQIRSLADAADAGNAR
jgi:hypothetical protein